MTIPIFTPSVMTSPLTWLFP
ncbi:Glycosyltransferase (fragment) [Lactobacillus delbrueckii subsp. bulgaricus]